MHEVSEPKLWEYDKRVKDPTVKLFTNISCILYLFCQINKMLCKQSKTIIWVFITYSLYGP